MEKNWTYNGNEYIMIRKGYGLYSLNGYYFTDSTVWDNVDNDEDLDKQLEAFKVSESFINTK